MGPKNHPLSSPMSISQSPKPFNSSNAALIGATSAFAKSSVNQKPSINTYTGTNGALVAATLAHSPDVLSRQSTGGSSKYGSQPPPQPFFLPSSPLGLSPPRVDPAARTWSPSNIAATLAAARHSPGHRRANSSISKSEDIFMERREVFPPSGSVSSAKERLGVSERVQDGSPRPRLRHAVTVIGSGDATDETPILPTNALIHRFEQNAPSVKKPRALEPVKRRQGTPPPIKSPKPQRVFSLPSTGSVDGPSDDPKNLQWNKVKAEGKLESDKGNQDLPPPSDIVSKPNKTSKPKVAEKKPVRIPAQRVDSQDAAILPQEPKATPVPKQEPSKSKPELPPPRRSAKPSAPTQQTLAPESAALAIPQSQSRPDTSRHTSSSSATSPYQRESRRQIAQHMTGDSMANAIVGAALASSRTASPAISPISITPALPLRHRSQSSPHRSHNPFHLSRTPSPSKTKPGGLRQTLRKESTSPSDSEEEPHRKRRKAKRFLGHKHPNKHKEGTRKRWRNTITERERKRYEGVWAANRGLLLVDSTSPQIHAQQAQESQFQRQHQQLQDEVLNFVTKDIWTRSRLPTDVLEEVWLLVDERGVGRLRKEEFVVGLWLIDQALKGRKLPTRVSDSVWDSVRGVGMKVKIGGK